MSREGSGSLSMQPAVCTPWRSTDGEAAEAFDNSHMKLTICNVINKLLLAPLPLSARSSNIPEVRIEHSGIGIHIRRIILYRLKNIHKSEKTAEKHPYHHENTIFTCQTIAAAQILQNYQDS